MNNALYKNPNGTTKILKAIEISREDYQSIYKGHLFCTTSGCNAQLIYMPVEKKISHILKLSKEMTIVLIVQTISIDTTLIQALLTHTQLETKAYHLMNLMLSPL